MTQTRFEQGLEIRQAVLGEDYVQKSLSNATEFTRPLQELVTEYCWGAVWSREGIDLKTRSLINIAMLTALGRGAELKLHTEGALNNGATPDEIREVLLQTAIYAGVPAALDGFRIAGAVVQARAQDQEG